MTLLALWVICTIVSLIAAPGENFWCSLGFGLGAALMMWLFLSVINWIMSHYRPLEFNVPKPVDSEEDDEEEE